MAITLKSDLKAKAKYLQEIARYSAESCAPRGNARRNTGQAPAASEDLARHRSNPYQ